MAGKRIFHNGKLKTVKQAAEDEGVTYHTMYMRYKAHVEGKSKRKTQKRAVTWNGKDYVSISEMARDLGISREWARQLIKKNEVAG
jgi:hypothetical protein